jgi:adenine-specific DNA-methyltransferase
LESKSANNILAEEDCTPTEYADKLGLLYSSRVTGEHKKDLGQFFTPMKIAQFMAGFASMDKETITILDPGCGIGILSAAVCEILLVGKNSIKNISLIAFETDVEILPLTEQCFEYLRGWIHKKKIGFTFLLVKNDFILHNSSLLRKKEVITESYDIVISNPPYFKLPKDDSRIIAAKEIIFGQPNIYSLFLILAARLLNEHGKLIFITPRSFCSGNYFRLFRETFFSLVNLRIIHLFNSRKETFKRDKVLQENIIVVATRKRIAEEGQLELSLATNEATIVISSSKGMNDLAKRRVKEYHWSDLINMDSNQKILHLPSSDIDEKVISIFKTWTGSLNAYGLEISTGPVVDFRSLEMIRHEASPSSVPLIWLHNIESMAFLWPRPTDYKGKAREQYIENNEGSTSRLITNKNYIFVRRFSSKDDNRRLIAAPYFKQFLPDFSFLGAENHLNYVYKKEGELSEMEAHGFAALLNSRLFDLYFRTFNGNINVSATELRDFPLPDFELIKTLGQRIMAAGDNLEIDELVASIFNIQLDLSKLYG